MSGIYQEFKQAVIKSRETGDFAPLKKQTESMMSLTITGLTNVIGNTETTYSYDTLNDPLYANILMGINIEVTEDVGAAMAVGTKKGKGDIYFFVNPYYLYEITDNLKQVVAIVRHELLHLIFEHLFIYKSLMEKGEPYRTAINIATDCQINQILKDLPEGCVTLKTVEEIVGNKLKEREGSQYYLNKILNSDKFKQAVDQKETFKNFIQELTSSVKEDTKQGNQTQSEKVFDQYQDKIGDGQFSQGEKDFWRQIVSQNLTEQEENVNGKRTGQKIDGNIFQDVVKDLITQSYKDLTEKQRGMISKDLVEQIETLYKAKNIRWNNMIVKGLSSISSMREYSIKRPNRRQPRRLDLPGIRKESKAKLVVGVDTSGSISYEELQFILGEIDDMINKYNFELDLLFIDTEIKGVYHNIKDVKKVEVRGRGGTVFQPFFDYLKENKYKPNQVVPVYFTDGFGESDLDRGLFKRPYWVLVGEKSRPENLSDRQEYDRIILLRQDKKYNDQVLSK